MTKGFGLLLAGLAAYGYYKYSKMSPQQKNDLMQKGRKIFDSSVGNIFKRKTA
jgi:hypothetical protein